jgi:Tol biopolymer transport system component
MKTLPYIELWFAILITTILAQHENRNHKITIEDYFTQSYINSCSTSPDGQYIAYIESRWDQQKDGRTYELWVVDIKKKSPQRLTFDLSKKENPQWRADGKSIYFIGYLKRESEVKPPYL